MDINGGLYASVPEKELESELRITIEAGEELGVGLIYSAIFLKLRIKFPVANKS